TWDPHTHPVISEVSGRLKFVDLIDGITMNRQTDELTGLSNIVIIDGITMNRQTDELTGLSNIVIIDAKQRSAAGRDL
ncbi:hypothetical protein MXD98_16770, partial [Legionella pneumophila]|nr:hypothetical protein [Legionella pneumophila]